jgi:hypothetical protein
MKQGIDSLKKIDKVGKSLRQTKHRKKEDTQINEIKYENGDITTDTSITKINRIFRECCLFQLIGKAGRNG